MLVGALHADAGSTGFLTLEVNVTALKAVLEGSTLPSNTVNNSLA